MNNSRICALHVSIVAPQFLDRKRRPIRPCDMPVKTIKNVHVHRE